MKNRDLEILKEPFRSNVKAWLKECPELSVDETFRSEERQKELFASGASKIKHSRHQDSEAIDVFFKGAELYPKDFAKWRHVADVARKYNIDWGYDLWASTGFIDMAHFEMHTINPPTMDLTFEHNYLNIGAEEVRLTTVGHNHARSDSLEEQMKAIAEIVADRKVKKIAEILASAKDLKDGLDKLNNQLSWKK
jgi:hypothetical protein